MTAKTKALLFAGLLTATVASLDQWSKDWAEAAYQKGTTHLIGSIVELDSVHNSGIAFGRLAGAGVWITVLIAAALIALLYYFLRHLNKPFVWLPVGLILGGAIGNLIDRATLGYVYDFISIGPWPSFNLADSVIVVGVIILFILVEIVGRHQDGEESVKDEQPLKNKQQK